MADKDRRQYLIQIEHKDKGNSATLDQLSEVLGKTGVELDPDYRPIQVNPALSRYVVRGWANKSARAKAEKIAGVQFFSDLGIGPAANHS
jgi:hypothetical protein